MDHEEGWTIGPVPDGLNTRNISKTVTGRGRLGPTTQLGPLHGPELSEGGSVKEAYRIPT